MVWAMGLPIQVLTAPNVALLQTDAVRRLCLAFPPFPFLDAEQNTLSLLQ
jgi:hypothetical protein